ncbi:unnamed protein product [Cylindrotheca closterium]|uniref:Uncharacterized protein n=1 Tax=Cylindrotheca closterium TaxID=2856 RepID=A0AAD2FUF9_9STRA|nr:unnamed protein product [Cylindrotheca closterium]
MTDLTQYVQAGACVRSGGAPGLFGMAVGCAFEFSDCEGAIFRSSRELLLAGSETVGYICLDRAIDTRVGRCINDSSYVCTSDAGSCAEEDGFEPVSDDCSMLVDRSPQRKQKRTHFGGCTDPAFPFPTKCYWSVADCDTEGSDGMQWISAGSNSKCTCEETLTGACESNGEYYCAVSEFGCDSYSTFVPAARLPAGVTCFLCKKYDDSIIETKSAQVVEPIVPSTPQLLSQNQSAPQDDSPSEPPQREPTSSPENYIPATFPTSDPVDVAAKLQPHFEKDTVALYVAIPTMLLFTLLLCCAITCTGSKSQQQLGGKSPSEEDEGMVESPKGELA